MARFLFFFTSLVLALTALPAAQEPSGSAEAMSRGRAALDARDHAAAEAAYLEVLASDADNAQAWLLLGYARHSAGKLEAALEAHLKAAEFPATRATATYNCACVHALRGEKDRAFTWLGKAIGRGFTSAGHAESDADLASLRADPRFAEYLELMRSQSRSSSVNVAVFIHDGVELLDFAGPGEVFSGAGGPDGRRCHVFTVSQSTVPVTSQGFLKVVPQFTFEDCPEPDVIVLPGGNTTRAMRTTDVVAWVKKTAPRTQVVLSVCTGAFILGHAGLLDGLEATTHWSAIAGLERDFPACSVLRDVRVVDNGRIVTSAGVSAGIDGALHVVQKLFGDDAAVRRARGLEYAWKPSEHVEPVPAATPKTASAAATGPFRCPPCRCKSCGAAHDAAGFCADCGMRLVSMKK